MEACTKRKTTKMLSLETLEFIMERLWYDYQMGNSLYHSQCRRALYLHDEKMLKDIEAKHGRVRNEVLEEIENAKTLPTTSQ